MAPVVAIDIADSTETNVGRLLPCFSLVFDAHTPSRKRTPDKDNNWPAVILLLPCHTVALTASLLHSSLQVRSLECSPRFRNDKGQWTNDTCLPNESSRDQWKLSRDPSESEMFLRDPPNFVISNVLPHSYDFVALFDKQANQVAPLLLDNGYELVRVCCTQQTLSKKCPLTINNYSEYATNRQERFSILILTTTRNWPYFGDAAHE